MKQLLYKELRLCLPLMMPLYLAFSLMLLIPNYLYLIAFFFACNAIMYIFTMSQQNNDLLFSAMLPVSKREVVRARFLLIVLYQAAMLLLCTGMIFLNRVLYPQGAEMSGNQAGLDASPMLLAAGLVLMGLYNITALPKYYQGETKLGRIILVSMIVKFAYVFAIEFFAMAACQLQESVPLFMWFEQTLDCFPTAPNAWLWQSVALLVGLLGYALLTFSAYRRAAQNFERVNL